ncbi:MAG: lysyl oxidase family protein, partial [Actinomycetota bacterium]|nr:lysyl oxidase family protein [Actinomycetota bacterium]
AMAAVGALALAAGILAAAPAAVGQVPGGLNPCLGPLAAELLCPDLVMRPPYDLRIDRRTRPGRVLLRAANSIDSVGVGPAELRGRRDGPRTMAARQRILRRDGTRLTVSTGARLYFKAIPGQGHYWKFHHAARFELWSLDANGARARLVRTGPKVSYCLRDLVRRNPRLRRSPRRRVYPACNRRAGQRRVTLGTSVGWSDVYPASYHEQWVDVTGLRGRFSLVHLADPRNGIWELDERNNSSETILVLPSGRALRTRGGGGGPDRGY